MTPHPIVLVGEEGKIIATFPSEGEIRLSQVTERAGYISYEEIDIPISKTSFGSTELPKEEEGTMYIVSSLVCQAFPDRPDLYIPNESVRDEQGRIVGCKSLSQNPFLTNGSENDGN